MRLKIKHSNLFILLLSVFIAASSCTATKKVVYLNDLTPADSIALRTAQIAFETPIQKNDQLWITVGGSNPPDLSILNSGIGMPLGLNAVNAGPSSANLGYLVEADGNIKLPYLGKVKAEGLSRQSLEVFLTKAFESYTKNPIVNVRFLNNYVTVIGEVYRPGKMPMTTERMTILEALGLAGDITDYAKRENVLVIREINGVRNIERINLLSKSLFSSPYFYLRNNDVVYVEPVRVKFISRSGIPQYLSVAAVGLSLLITIINVTK
jgi:polysaccharide export outer membrane protein